MSEAHEETPLRGSKLSPSEVETVRNVLRQVQKGENKRIREGFNEFNFSAGTLNCILLAYIFGSHPEHFWCLYLLEAIILIPYKMWSEYHAKPLNQVLYHLDYCWVMNFLMVVGLILLTSTRSIQDHLREYMFLAVVGTGCGPLLGACVILPFCALVVHDRIVLSNVFIHLTPPMLVYTLLWHSQDIKEAWPNVFKLDIVDTFHFYPSPEEGVFFLGSAVGVTLVLYVCWFSAYVLWMLTMGLNLPRKVHKGKTLMPRYDTVFHATVRGGLCELIGTICWGRSPEESSRQMTEDDYETRDFVVYMLGHAVMVTFATTVVAYACAKDKYIHAGFVWILVVICIVRGAKRYVYWVTRMSSQAIEKEYRGIMESREPLSVNPVSVYGASDHWDSNRMPGPGNVENPHAGSR